MTKRPDSRSEIAITFSDGLVKTFEISASVKIAGYLMREAASTGMLVMRNDPTGEVFCVPMNVISYIAMKELPMSEPDAGAETPADEEPTKEETPA